MTEAKYRERRNYYFPLDVAREHGPKMAFLWAAIARYYPIDATAAWPTRQQLADELQVSRRTVSNWIQRAKEIGLLTIKERPGKPSMIQLKHRGHAWAPGVWEGIEWLFIPPEVWNLEQSIHTRAFIAYCNDKDRARWSTVRRALGMSKSALYEARSVACEADLLDWTGEPAVFHVEVPKPRNEADIMQSQATPEKCGPSGKGRDMAPLKDTDTRPHEENIQSTPSNKEQTPEGKKPTPENHGQGHSVQRHREVHKTNTATNSSSKGPDSIDEIDIPKAVCSLLKQKRKSRQRNFYDQLSKSLQQQPAGIVQSALDQFGQQLNDGAKVTSPWGYFRTILKAKAQDMAQYVALQRRSEQEIQRRQQQAKRAEKLQDRRATSAVSFWRWVDRQARLTAKRQRGLRAKPDDQERSEVLQQALSKYNYTEAPPRPDAKTALSA